MTRHVLVVDDDADVCRGLEMTLRRRGYSVEAASGGEEALERLARRPADALVTDLRMAGVDGLELLRRVRERWPRTPVVVLTAYGAVAEAVEAMRAGAFHFLTKPVENETLQEVLGRALRERDLEVEVARLREEVARGGTLGPLVGRDPAILGVYATIDKVAASSVPVLISGESGTGKELVARMVHDRSPRAARRFIAVNTASLPDTLLEAELFGCRKGAFTGADADRQGIFQGADRGTVFLDEVASMSAAFQARLLRVLQEGEVVPLGSYEAVKVDVRVVAATHRDLARSVREGGFREDLYYRLNVVPVRLPPLRERPGDIPLLAEHLLERCCEAQGLPRRPLTPAALRVLTAYRWPGNVRELENTLHRA
ncbi:MAG: sigma-54-dependent Fis family transcriptional regulator, partial [Planctomycetes bacterium]|nr:sigma-54-dependent Fis family transcriptional regulator [Planctomycetota bacterium]